MSEIFVSNLVVYPIKSCRGIELDESVVVPTGLEHDREFMLVDQEAKFLSQRRQPNLARVLTKLANDGLYVYAEGMDGIYVPFNSEGGPLVEATLHNKPVAGEEVSPEASAWFSEYLKTPVKLLQTSLDNPRHITDRYYQPEASNRVGFADSFSMLLTSEVSFTKLSEALAEPVPHGRFRPNIVINGIGLESYAEDYWRRLRIGNVSAYVVRGSARCEVPDVDQVTGEVGKTVRQALAKTRRDNDSTDGGSNGVFFGQNLNHIYEEGLILQVGDLVTVEEKAEEPNLVLRQRT